MQDSPTIELSTGKAAMYIYITGNRTKFEREKHKKLVEEHKERCLQGVKDLVICNGACYNQ